MSISENTPPAEPVNPAAVNATAVDPTAANIETTSDHFICEALAPWRVFLSRALHRNRAVPFSRYLQLATLRANGRPANRTVVFRGFLNQTNHLMFISDLRSEKTLQIQQNPNAEACWYFTKTREQFRLSGQLTLVTAHDEDDEHKTPSPLQIARQQIWQNISDNARIQFAWPQPKTGRENTPANAFHPTPPDAPDELTPPETFTLVLLSPDYIDHLELRGNPQNRHIYQKGSGTQEWNISNVNP
ncbi:MAG: Npun_F5749 family FMN-dependent PPOX-type flavoprotein [Cyanobacteria bacterium P01_D01_bin.105]